MEGILDFKRKCTNQNFALASAPNSNWESYQEPLIIRADYHNSISQMYTLTVDMSEIIDILSIESWFVTLT